VQSVARILLATSVVAALSSCSLFSSPSSTSVALDEASEGANWKELQSSPYVYEITDSDSNKTFLTAIKDCDRKKGVSPLVANRQLLVGFKDIKFQNQEKISIAELPAVRSQVSAKFEERPINLLAYTVIRKECVFDFVLWRSISDVNDRGETALLEQSEKVSRFLSMDANGLLN
jgi:hypothetical protein